MTPATDDSVPRDPRFDTAWRAASHEEPLPALDAAIRAAARREVGAKPQSLSAQAALQAHRRWWPLAAAATVAVIAIGVVQRAGHDELVVPPSDNSIVSDMPAQTAKSLAEAPQRAPEAPQRAPEAPGSDDGRAKTAPSAAGGAAEGRARADSAAASQGKLKAQPAPHTDAFRRSAPNAAPPTEKKSESVVSAAPSSPEPFPATSPKPSAAAPRDATAAPSAPANTGEIAAAAPAPQVAPSVSPPVAPMAQQSTERSAAQRQEAKTLAKPAAPPMSQAAPPVPPPMPPAASFADSTRVSAPSEMRSSPIAKTANAGTAEDARIKDRAPLPVADWIALIRRLRDEAKTIEAARELTAFRAAHTDHEKLLPPDLRDWHPADK